MSHLQTCCNPDLSRRLWLRIGMASSAGAVCGRLLNAAPRDSRFGQARRCIQVFLNGGPSQLDTFDMKPSAPADVRGELAPIASKIPGIMISELFPRLARQVDKIKIVRSVTHEASVHTTGVYTMLTGIHHSTPTVDQLRATGNDHPHLGSIISHYRGTNRELPPFFSLPSLFQAPPVSGIWPGQNAGFLGANFDPFVITGDTKTARFQAPAISIPPDLNRERILDRKRLLQSLDRRCEMSGLVGERKSELWDGVLALLDKSGIDTALDLSSESPASRERYGDHLFGNGILVARRLLEAGETFVTVYWNDPTPAGDGGGEFDSHGRLYWHMRNRLAEPTDRAIAALIADLWDRGLHESTLLVVMSEFGRTPKINRDAGRDHWPQAQSILLGGVGITGGTVHGSTDRWAAYPASDPVSPPDLAQSLLHLMGVPAHLEFHDRQGKPAIASPGRVDHSLIA